MTREQQPEQPAGMPEHNTPIYDTGTPETAPAPAVRDKPPHSDHTREPAHKPAEHYEPNKVKSSLAGGTWAALIIGALLLILLIVFILQNQQQVEVTLFAWSFHFPAGIAYLLAALVGALIMALVGGWRMFELRRQVKKAQRGR